MNQVPADCYFNIRQIKQNVFVYFIVQQIVGLQSKHICFKGCRGRDRIVVVFTITCAISAYHH